MNKVRTCIGAGLILIGITLIPASLSYAKDRSWTAQNNCSRSHTLCKEQCSKYKAPELVKSCRNSCDLKYKSCMEAAKAGPSGPSKP